MAIKVIFNQFQKEKVRVKLPLHCAEYIESCEKLISHLVGVG